MNRILYLDPEILDTLMPARPPDPDPELITAVNEALSGLKPELRELIIKRFYEGRKISEIESELDRPEKEIMALLYEAKRQLRSLLADFARERWGIEVRKGCRICAHARRAEIEKILLGKKERDSWRKTTLKIRDAAGESFHPPQILIAHMKHIKGGE